MFGKDEQKIDFRDEYLAFSLSRSQILYNRALAFCSLDLYHRARDDIITAIPTFYCKESESKAKLLLINVEKVLKTLSLNQLIQYVIYFLLMTYI